MERYISNISECDKRNPRALYKLLQSVEDGQTYFVCEDGENKRIEN